VDQREIEQILKKVGFVDISVERKPQSRDVIKHWLPGSRAEEYVVSADIKARKPTEKERMAAFLNAYTSKMQKEKDAMEKNKEIGHGHGQSRSHGSKSSSGDAPSVENSVPKKKSC
jgi:hypothetical protein